MNSDFASQLLCFGGQLLARAGQLLCFGGQLLARAGLLLRSTGLFLYNGFLQGLFVAAIKDFCENHSVGIRWRRVGAVKLPS